MKKLIFTRRKKHTQVSIKRVVLSVAALLLISLCINFVPTTVKADTCTPTTYESIKIHSGDTLWNIAKEYNSSNIPTRDYVEEIKEVNGLTSEHIMDGNYILVPIYE